MAIRPDWSIGTITLTASSANFTTTGALLETAAIEPGDAIITPSGAVLVISSITGQDSGTLMLPCPAGAAGTNMPLRIRFQPDGSRFQAAYKAAAYLLSGGNVDALAGLAGENGKLPIFTGNGTMGLVDEGDVGIKDPNGNLGELAGLALTANKAITTDGSGNAQQSNLGTLGRALLALATGTSAQYVQGDGTLQAKSGLPVSTATQTALNGKANLSGADFTGYVKTSGSGGNIISGPGAELRSRSNRSNTGTGQINQGGFIRSIISNDDNSLGWRMTLYSQEVVGTRVEGVISVASGAGTSSFFTFGYTGSLDVPGALSKGSGTFLIDHPLDPFNKNLRHGFVEAPRYDLIYRGAVQLVNGRATVDIDAASNMTTGTFQVLTTNAVVTSLQNQDGFARLRPGPLDGGYFEIICEDEECTDLVSWVVIAERNDPFVKSDLDQNTDSDGRFVPEFDKEDA